MLLKLIIVFAKKRAYTGGNMFDLFDDGISTSWLDEAIDEARNLAEKPKLAET
jgi:hypothetical protein